MDNIYYYFVNNEFETDDPIILKSDNKIILDILVKVYEEMTTDERIKDDENFKSLKFLFYDYRHRKCEMKFNKFIDDKRKHLKAGTKPFHEIFKSIFHDVLLKDIEEKSKKYLWFADKMHFFERFDMFKTDFDSYNNEISEIDKLQLMADIVYNVSYNFL